MFGVKAALSGNAARAAIADPEAAAAYRSLEAIVSIGDDDRAAPDVGRLTRAVLRAYALALGESQPEQRPILWTTFVRRAALLCFAFECQRERLTDPRRQRAVQALRQITLENADLLARSLPGKAS